VCAILNAENKEEDEKEFFNICTSQREETNEKVPPFIVSREEKYGKEGYGNK
jgi:hypothetical protein